MGYTGKHEFIIIMISVYTYLFQIHLGQVMAQPIRFDPVSKMAYYSIMMDPVKIKTMFDHKRPIHCSLLRKNNSDYGSKNAFVITVEKGMKEGKTIQMDIKNDLCQVQAELTRLPTPPPSPELQKQDYFKTDSISSLAPAPLTYTLQITELCLPLSTIAA